MTTIDPSTYDMASSLIKAAVALMVEHDIGDEVYRSSDLQPFVDALIWAESKVENQ